MGHRVGDRALPRQAELQQGTVGAVRTDELHADRQPLGGERERQGERRHGGRGDPAARTLPRVVTIHRDAGSTLLVVGGEGLVVEVEKAGFVVTRSADDAPAAVVQGFAPEVGWKQLAEAAYALATPIEEGGIPWIATNTDWTIPQARGIAPGNGTLVSAVHTAVGRLATVAGKPERAIFDVAVARTGARSPLFIGDRLDTDVQGARAAGMASVHVLTGIDRPKQLLAAAPNQRPDYIVEDLRQLFEPYPATIVKGERTRVGDAVVEIDGVDLRVVSDGGRQIDLLRAGAAAIWNSGRAIFGFRVPEQLYADPFRVR